MTLANIALTTLAIHIIFVTALHTADPRRCVANSGVTTFKGCHAWDSLVSQCSQVGDCTLDIATPVCNQPHSYYNCYCAQDYLNALYDCNSEERLCVGTDYFDDDFIEAESSWHKVCDPILNYKPTTPVLSSIAAPYDVSYCLTASSACYSMTVARERCTDGDISSISSCLCAPEALSLEFTCSVLGNVSCIQVPAHLDQMSGYTYCNNIQQVLTLPPSLTASLGPETTIHLTYDPRYSLITAGPAVTGPVARSPSPTTTSAPTTSAPTTSAPTTSAPTTSVNGSEASRLSLLWSKVNVLWLVGWVVALAMMLT